MADNEWKSTPDNIWEDTEDNLWGDESLGATVRAELFIFATLSTGPTYATIEVELDPQFVVVGTQIVKGTVETELEPKLAALGGYLIPALPETELEAQAVVSARFVLIGLAETQAEPSGPGLGGWVFDQAIEIEADIPDWKAAWGYEAQSAAEVELEPAMQALASYRADRPLEAETEVIADTVADFVALGIIETEGEFGAESLAQVVVLGLMEIESEFPFVVATQHDDEVPVTLTVVLTGVSMEPSIFTGFTFNSFCVMPNGKTYGATDEGIFLLAGDTDNGKAIRSGLRLLLDDLSTARDRKKLRSVYLGPGGAGAEVTLVTENRTKSHIAHATGATPQSRDTSGRLVELQVRDFQELRGINTFVL